MHILSWSPQSQPIYAMVVSVVGVGVAAWQTPTVNSSGPDEGFCRGFTIGALGGGGSGILDNGTDAWCWFGQERNRLGHFSIGQAD